MPELMTPKEFFEKFPTILVDDWTPDLMQKALRQLNARELSGLLTKTDMISDDFIRDALGDLLLDIRKDV